jgi:hypothetical protein
MISLTALIAVAGIISATIFNNQLTVMKGQLREMESAGKQTETMIETNKTLAEAAQKSAEVAQTSLVKLQRASIFMPDINTNWHRDTSRPGKFWWHFRPIYANSGNTQPLGMTTNVVFVLRDTPLPEGYDFPPDTANHPATVIPHGSILGRSENLTDEQLIEVQKGNKFYYIYGTIIYHDIFDGTPIHTTKFCRQVVNLLGDLTRPDQEVTEMFFAIAFPEYNTAD